MFALFLLIETAAKRLHNGNARATSKALTLYGRKCVGFAYVQNSMQFFFLFLCVMIKLSLKNRNKDIISEQTNQQKSTAIIIEFVALILYVDKQREIDWFLNNIFVFHLAKMTKCRKIKHKKLKKKLELTKIRFINWY